MYKLLPTEWGVPAQALTDVGNPQNDVITQTPGKRKRD